MKAFTILIILAILNLGLVAPALSLSEDCRSAFLEFITDNSTEKCLPVKEVLRLSAIADPKANATTKANTITTFATNVCPLYEKCGDTEIEKISENGKKLISTGCAKDLNTTDPIAVLALSGITLYPPIIKSLCFQDNSTKSFCFREDAATIQALPQPNFTFIDKSIDKVIFSDPNRFCVPCFQNIINTIFDFIFNPNDKAREAFNALLTLLEVLKVPFTSLQLSQLKTTVMIKCGFKFLDNPGI
ncbi:14697_t:CDS:1 [Cetraspora pellucida]|uniref:14697_t:CDS:1 n=1 Tax=Cetraspora pellucida TaxID=1433469 RepID=A0A9N9AMF6_9GLOM|nr:14697_t:CDS:1 [Cetraspora pellucida]